MAVYGTQFLERIQFFNGQRLFASDLQALEAFNREMRWLHNQSLHQPGVGSGGHQLEPFVLLTIRVRHPRFSGAALNVHLLGPVRIFQFELAGVNEELARGAMERAIQKLPIRAKFVTRHDQEHV
mgnify:CR=1 FL=1